MKFKSFEGKAIYPIKTMTTPRAPMGGEKTEFKYLDIDGNAVHPAIAMRRLKVWFSKTFRL